MSNGEWVVVNIKSLHVSACTAFWRVLLFFLRSGSKESKFTYSCNFLQVTFVRWHPWGSRRVLASEFYINGVTDRDCHRDTGYPVS